MKNNNRGLAEVAILLYVIGALVLFFVPNPVSNAVGIGVKPNKTVETDSVVEKVDILKDADGTPIMLKTTTKRAKANNSIQVKVTFWEWLMSLPIFVLVLMFLGIVFPPISMVLGALWRGLKKETKKIVVSVDHALDHINDPSIKATLKSKMSESQDDSTKRLVNKIQGK